ncbi:MAG: hypothetical protein AAGA56_28490, partial [Myxococcota bacterium]
MIRSDPPVVSEPAPVSSIPPPPPKRAGRRQAGEPPDQTEEFDGLRATVADGPEAKRVASIVAEARRAAAQDEAVSSSAPADEGTFDGDITVDDDFSLEANPPPSIAPPAPNRVQRSAEMSVQDHLEAGDLARDLKHHDEALSHYKKGLAKLGIAQTPERADLYVRIGEVLSGQNRPRVAQSNFEKALQIVPDHRRALDLLLGLEIAEKRWREVSHLEERIFAAAPEEERLELLLKSGARWRAEARDDKRAIERYQQARGAFPKARLPHERLLELFEARGDTDDALDMRTRIADLVEEGPERARFLTDLGRRCVAAGREHEAQVAFEKALEADPTQLVALEQLASTLAAEQEWAELERVYTKIIERFRERAPSEATTTVLAELTHRLALLYREHLEDPKAALRAASSVLKLRPRHLQGHILAYELALELNKGQRALTHLRRRIALSPQDPTGYHLLFALGQRYDIPELSFLAATVTECLGVADDRETIVYREYRPQGVPGHSKPLTDESWESLLDDHDATVDAVMVAIAPAVIRVRVGQLQGEGKLPELLPERRQDPGHSTVSAVRSFTWAARLLGVELPDIYVDEERKGSIYAPMAAASSLVVGQDALRGRSRVELAF